MQHHFGQRYAEASELAIVDHDMAVNRQKVSGAHGVRGVAVAVSMWLSTDRR